MNIKRIFLLLIDIVIIWAAFLVCVWYKPASLRIYLPSYIYPFLVFAGIWIAISSLASKYKDIGELTIKKLNKNIIVSNFVVLGTISLLIFALQLEQYSRFIVFGTGGLASAFEIIVFNLIFYLVHSEDARVVEKEVLNKQQLQFDFESPVFPDIPKDIEATIPERIKTFIVKECGANAFRFLIRFIDPANPRNLLISTTTRFNIDKQPDEYYENLANLKRINDIRYLNKFFESVNAKMPVNGLFIGFVETKNQRKQRILRKYPPIFNYIFYTIDFMFKRVFPKFVLTKKLYFFLTRGNNRVLTRAETLGRLYSCGFQVVEERFIDNFFYFVVRKTGKPVFDPNPTYGPFIKLKRVGKNGKIVNVYKFRTMHPYAEYLQDYVYQKNKLQEGGKFKDDFRISNLGKFMRKLWIDELPMILNWLKGDLKIVGVRPISKHYFDLYPEELRQKRIKTKPGLVPPFYADMPKSLDEIVETELKYLESYFKKPLRTDTRYFFLAFYNIIFKRARSA